MFVLLAGRYPASQLSCMAQSLTLNITQILCPNIFIPAMPIDILDYYPIISPSGTLTLGGGHKVDTKQTCWHHFLPHFSTELDKTLDGDEATQAEDPDIIYERVNNSWEIPVV